MPLAIAGTVDLANINQDIIPSIDNSFDMGLVDKRWRNIQCGSSVIIDGDLTVNGTITTGNLELNGNTISSLDTDGDMLLFPDGIGSVGIGVVSPVEKLDVDGNIKAVTIIDNSIYAQLSSSINQEPSDTNPTIILYENQDAISGIIHSTTTNPGEITIETAGIYLICCRPQVGKDSGGVKVIFDLFMQIDTGSGFEDEADTNIKRTIKDPDITDIVSSEFTVALNAGDKFRMMQKVSNAGFGMGLKNTPAIVGPPAVPRTPSVVLTMHRIGGLSA